MKAFIVLYFFAIVTFVNCETVFFKRCTYWDYCKIHEVRVSPVSCPSDGSYCQIRKREKVNISFDFNSYSNANLSLSNIFLINDNKTWQLFEKNQDACLSITCPVKAGEKQNYSIELQLNADFPCESLSKMRWMLWGPSTVSDGCCVEFPIVLHD